MTAVGLGGEVDAVPCVLGESAHETLECLPHVWCGGGGAIRGQAFIPV
jgi:hypothetical protein